MRSHFEKLRSHYISVFVKIICLLYDAENNSANPALRATQRTVFYLQQPVPTWILVLCKALYTIVH